MDSLTHNPILSSTALYLEKLKVNLGFKGLSGEIKEILIILP